MSNYNCLTMMILRRYHANYGELTSLINTDVSGPIENGIAPACRALVAPIEMATGTQAYFCGKPNPLMMRTGLNMLGCHSAEAVMVGDRMDTDVISGMESGMSTWFSQDAQRKIHLKLMHIVQLWF